MKKIIFLAIAGYLDSVLNTPGMITKYGQCKYIARDNNQFEMDAEEHAIPKPAIVIGFPDTDWDSKTNNQQNGALTISVKIAYATIADSNFYETQNNTQAYKRDEYVQDVQIALQGLDLGLAGKLLRVREIEDNNHDHITIDQINYLTIVSDQLADPTLQYIEVTPQWQIIYSDPTGRPTVLANPKYIVHGHI